MTKKLPHKNFCWEENWNKEDMKVKIENYHPQDKVGYMIECDLKYPADIHDLTKDLLLAPEHRVVVKESLSPYAQALSTKLNIKPDKIPKLLSTQYDKKRYVCHIENLQFYLKKGMKLQRIHRVLRFQPGRIRELRQKEDFHVTHVGRV